MKFKIFLFLALLGCSQAFAQREGIKGKSSKDFNFVPQDNFSFALETIFNKLASVNRGEVFFVSGFDSLGSSGADDSLGIAFTTSSDTDSLFRLSLYFLPSDSTKLSILESVTMSSGTALTAYNMNRQSSNTAEMTVTLNPNISNAGTKIDSTYVLDDLGASFELFPGLEIVLKANTTYLFLCESLAGSNNYVNFRAVWNEQKLKE